ncbi:MAG: DUF2608 domain-containing protein [Desulfobacterium sp.]|nr:DUF2608 domain-containing protein [Desulfobacterium sp.]
MRYILRLFLSTFLFISCSISYADTSKSQVGSFLELKNIVLEINEPQATLVVMDDDDTLTMMRCLNDVEPSSCQYLGGPAWYEWQSGLLGSKSFYRVAKDQDELLKISALLFAMNKMDYTEDDIGSILNRLSDSGVRLLVETARSGSNLSATEMQLDDLKVPGSSYGSFLDMIRSNSLFMRAMNSPSLPSPFTPCDIPGSREVSYQQGVMYVAGQNKGIMLICLLSYYENDNSGNTSLPIKNIVFIDDTQKNVDDVYNAFKNSTRYQVKALHYTALDSHKQALTKPGKEGEMLQNKAKERWDAIHSTLSKQLLSPATGKK